MAAVTPNPQPHRGLLMTGENNLNGLTNTEITRRILEKVPNGTYTSIFTASVNYDFFGAAGTLASKRIRLERSSFSVTGEFFRAVIMGIFGNESDESQRYSTAAVNTDKIKAHFFDRVINGDSRKELETAFYNCRSISLIISNDCNWCDIEVTGQHTAISVARSIGAVGKTVLQVAPMVCMVILMAG